MKRSRLAAAALVVNAVCLFVCFFYIIDFPGQEVSGGLVTGHLLTIYFAGIFMNAVAIAAFYVRRLWSDTLSLLAYFLYAPWLVYRIQPHALGIFSTIPDSVQSSGGIDHRALWPIIVILLSVAINFLSFMTSRRGRIAPR